MPSKRLSRKELTQKDEITSTLERMTTYTVEHSRMLLAVLALVAAVVIAGVGWSVYASNREAAAQRELSAVIRIYNDTAGYASDQARLQAVLDAAAQVRDAYGGLPAAGIARYYAALSHEGLGDLEEADRELRALIDSGDEAVHQVALYALAESYKKRGDLEGAIGVFQELADTGGYAQGAVLVELGRLHEMLSRSDEARGYYETVLSEYPDSPFRMDADRALKRLSEAAEPASDASES